MGTMNRILILLGVTSLVFMTVCFVFVWFGRFVPDSLIYSYFAAIGTEGFVMGWIKNAKFKMQNAELNAKCKVQNAKCEKGDFYDENN